MIILGMVVEPGLVYLVLGTIISLQIAISGWVIKEHIALRGRMHRLEAKMEYVDTTMTEIKNRMNEICDDLLPHRRKR